MGSIATAGEVDWCASDPLFTVNGQSFHLAGFWPSENQGSVNGVTYVLTVAEDATYSSSIPAGETASVTIIWERSGSVAAEHVIKASVTVNASASFRTKAELDRAGNHHAVYGTSNSAMKMVIPVR